jgi:hypothetical protein
MRLYNGRTLPAIAATQAGKHKIYLAVIGLPPQALPEYEH